MEGFARLNVSLRFVVAKWRVKREQSRRLPMAIESRPAAKREELNKQINSKRGE
jgi:hypothetical protein